MPADYFTLAVQLSRIAAGEVRDPQAPADCRCAALIAQGDAALLPCEPCYRREVAERELGR